MLEIFDKGLIKEFILDRAHLRRQYILRNGILPAQALIGLPLPHNMKPKIKNLAVFCKELREKNIKKQTSLLNVDEDMK